MATPEFAVYKAYMDERLARQASRIAQLEAGVRKLGQALLQVASLNNRVEQRLESIEEYDFVCLFDNGAERWVWKHFLRGAKSAHSFATREDAVNDAIRDNRLHTIGVVRHVERQTQSRKAG